MHRTAASVLAAFTVFGFATTRVGGPPDRHPGAMTVHEWGTFTTVAGTDGRAIDWLPLAGPTDLPCFVEHYENNPLVKIVAGSPKSVTYEAARASLKAKVRMETPVLYFYAPQETQADV